MNTKKAFIISAIVSSALSVQAQQDVAQPSPTPSTEPSNNTTSTSATTPNMTKGGSVYSPEVYQSEAFAKDEDHQIQTAARRMKGFATVDWDMGVAVGSLNDFVKNVSFAGLNVEGRWFLNRKFSLGVAFNWNRFSQDGPRETYNFQNGAITANLYRYAEFVTPKVTAHYYFVPDGPVMPYAGLGLGPTLVQSRLYVSDLVISDSNWHFMFSPEVGVLVPFKSIAGLAGLHVNARYNFTSADFANVSQAQFISWQIGFFQSF